jgi:signal transduction histidine kinase
VLLTVADGPGGVLWVIFIATASWAAGRLIRQRRLLIDELRETSDELARTRDRYAELAVETERARISRELHDVVAHSVSVMVVQAGAAERMIAIDPARAQGALGAIQSTGRQALQELRRVLGVLRSADGDADTTPQPGLGDLDQLAEGIRQAGVSVEIDRSGDVRPLPAGVELAAYRIVQEALTNVVKHAGVAAASVRLDYGPDWLDLAVTDDGVGGASLVPGAGQGLIGMTERAELYDGRLISGPGRDGGFTVTTRLRVEAMT